MLTQQNKLKLGMSVVAVAAVSVLSGCHVDMWIQPKAKPYYQSDFFADQQASRPLVPGAVPQGTLRLADAYHTGFDAPGKLTKTIPAQAVRSFASPKEMLQRGQDRYNVYCQPCHGKTGYGNGMIMQRGEGYWQKLAASYHSKRIREIQDGHIYDVITNGYGVMYSYSARIQDVNDRWAIVAYIRALQRAQMGQPATPELEKEVEKSNFDSQWSEDMAKQEEATREGADTRGAEMMKDKGNDYQGETDQHGKVPDGK